VAAAAYGVIKRPQAGTAILRKTIVVTVSNRCRRLVSRTELTARMGNSLDIYAGAGETANEPVPQPIRQTADRPHDRSLNTAEELAGADPSKMEIPTTAIRAVKPSVETVEVVSSNRQPQPPPVCRYPVTEDNPRSDRTATADDSGYARSPLWSDERTVAVGAKGYSFRDNNFFYSCYLFSIRAPES